MKHLETSTGVWQQDRPHSFVNLASETWFPVVTRWERVLMEFGPAHSSSIGQVLEACTRNWETRAASFFFHLRRLVFLFATHQGLSRLEERLSCCGPRKRHARAITRWLSGASRTVVISLASRRSFSWSSKCVASSIFRDLRLLRTMSRRLWQIDIEDIPAWLLEKVRKDLFYWFYRERERGL